MIGILIPLSQSICWLNNTHSVLPPSVPPESKIISIFFSIILSTSPFVRWWEKASSTLAPAPRQTLLAASTVSDSTSPMAAIFSPPAAEEQPIILSNLGFSSPSLLDKRERAFLYPNVISVSTVVK